MVLEKLGGRKFVLAILAVAVGTAVQILSPHGVNESFVALLVGITAAFGASNAFVSSKAINAEANEASGPDLSPIEAKIAEIEAQVAGANERTEQVALGLQQMGNSVELAAKAAKAALSVSKQNI